ncbi:MAG: hypothetical protein ACQXXC_01100 [Methanolinea tarda]
MAGEMRPFRRAGRRIIPVNRNGSGGGHRVPEPAFPAGKEDVRGQLVRRRTGTPHPGCSRFRQGALRRREDPCAHSRRGVIRGRSLPGKGDHAFASPRPVARESRR